MNTCRTCRWLNVPPDRDGKARPRKGRGYKCEWPADRIVLPRAITMYGGRLVLPRIYVEPDTADCPCWEVLT